MTPILRRLVTLALAGALGGCSYTSKMISEPSGADLTINGRYLGKTPLEFEDRGGVRRSYFIRIEKAGYETVEAEIESTYKADESLLLLIPGILPYFFSASLEDEYVFLLRPHP